MKRNVLRVVGFIVVVLIVLNSTYFEVKADTSNYYINMSLNRTYAGTLDCDDRYSTIYRINLPKSGLLTLKTVSTQSIVGIAVYRGDNLELPIKNTQTNSNVFGVYEDEISLGLLAGTYYIEVWNKNDYDSYGFDDLTYSIRAKFKSSKETFKERYTKQYDGFGDAKRIYAKKKYRGMLVARYECIDDYSDVYNKNKKEKEI